MCCDMHIESLYKQLQECLQKGQRTGINLSPQYAAAPHDETLFDSVMLSLKSTADGTLELRGAVSYWNPAQGYHGQSTTIRAFANADDCLTWLQDSSAASEECADVMATL